MRLNHLFEPIIIILVVCILTLPVASNPVESHKLVSALTGCCRCRQYYCLRNARVKAHQKSLHVYTAGCTRKTREKSSTEVCLLCLNNSKHDSRQPKSARHPSSFFYFAVFPPSRIQTGPPFFSHKKTCRCHKTSELLRRPHSGCRWEA